MLRLQSFELLLPVGFLGIVVALKNAADIEDDDFYSEVKSMGFYENMGMFVALLMTLGLLVSKVDPQCCCRFCHAPLLIIFSYAVSNRRNDPIHSPREGAKAKGIVKDDERHRI